MMKEMIEWSQGKLILIKKSHECTIINFKTQYYDFTNKKTQRVFKNSCYFFNIRLTKRINSCIRGKKITQVKVCVCPVNGVKGVG